MWVWGHILIKDTELKEIKSDDLLLFNGKNGMPAYIAFKGSVYDVSHGFLWRGGRHQVLHDAGYDLTQAMEKAPHGEDMLLRVKKIGILID